MRGGCSERCARTPQHLMLAVVDLRLAWRPVPSIELAVVGQNLLQPHHKEWGGGVEIRRGVYAEATWRP